MNAATICSGLLCGVGKTWANNLGSILALLGIVIALVWVWKIQVNRREAMEVSMTSAGTRGTTVQGRGSSELQHGDTPDAATRPTTCSSPQEPSVIVVQPNDDCCLAFVLKPSEEGTELDSTVGRAAAERAS